MKRASETSGILSVIPTFAYWEFQERKEKRSEKSI